MEVLNHLEKQSFRVKKQYMRYQMAYITSTWCFFSLNNKHATRFFQHGKVF